MAAWSAETLGKLFNAKKAQKNREPIRFAQTMTSHRGQIDIYRHLSAVSGRVLHPVARLLREIA